MDCNDCQTHVYNLEVGKPETYEVGDGEEKPVPRGKGNPPPCAGCPKAIVVDGVHKPDLDGERFLSPQNQMAVARWEELKATQGATRLPKHLENCALFASNMALISRIHESAEARVKVKAYEKAKQGRG